MCTVYMATYYGVQCPVFTVFHSTLDFTIVCFGLMTIIYRIDVQYSKIDVTRDHQRLVHCVSDRT
jgi:hypothetical protein